MCLLVVRELTPGPLTQHAVKGQEGRGGGSQCRVVAVRTNGSNGSVWRGAGVCSVHVVHGFP